MASVRVFITLGETRDSDPNVAHLLEIFREPYFLTEKVKGADEVTTTRYCLERSPSTPCLVIKDSSFTRFNYDMMVEAFNEMFNQVPAAGFYFLTVWQDKCNMYKRASDKLQWSINPTSTQAVVYTPAANRYVLDKTLNSDVVLSTVLNQAAKDTNLRAAVWSPPIVDYDLRLATANVDFDKANQCFIETNGSNQNNSAASIIWFWAFVAFILLLAWALIYLGPRPNNRQEKD